MTEKKSNIRYLLFTISAALLLMLASRSSFLYIFNNWDDANSYFSVGKALFNGKMPYRDVFDQKGMYLYFCTDFVTLFPTQHLSEFIFWK